MFHTHDAGSGFDYNLINYRNGRREKLGNWKFISFLPVYRDFLTQNSDLLWSDL